MIEFYQWASDNFVSFVAVTGVLAVAAVLVIEAARKEQK